MRKIAIFIVVICLTVFLGTAATAHGHCGHSGKCHHGGHYHGCGHY